jgi:hypothetical protein
MMRHTAIVVGESSAAGIVLGLAAVYLGLSFGVAAGCGPEFPY